MHSDQEENIYDEASGENLQIEDGVKGERAAITYEPNKDNDRPSDDKISDLHESQYSDVCVDNVNMILTQETTSHIEEDGDDNPEATSLSSGSRTRTLPSLAHANSGVDGDIQLPDQPNADAESSASKQNGHSYDAIPSKINSIDASTSEVYSTDSLNQITETLKPSCDGESSYEPNKNCSGRIEHINFDSGVNKNNPVQIEELIANAGINEYAVDQDDTKTTDKKNHTAYPEVSNKKN